MKGIVRSLVVPLVAFALLALLRTPGLTVPLYAARTGNQCQQCHFDPNGGGPRNDFGFAFARNRHAIDPEPEGSPWHDLTLTNKIGETMPVYVGVNQRLMLLTNNAGPPKGIDRLGFFNMENAIHLAFKPHDRLTLVYTTDAFASGASAGSELRDAWGMLGGLPLNGYVRAGRFRNPFGLRLDDHTVATRNGFLDFGPPARGREGFLAYDPRNPDMGVEIGAEHSGWFGRAAYTNGGADVVFQGDYAETKTVKLGCNTSLFQAAASFYDSYNKERVPVSRAPKRATRWGTYGMTHVGPVALLGEIAAGTDEAEPTVAGFASGPKTNRLAWFTELDYAPWRFANVRVRYDRFENNRSSDPVTRDANAHQRYAVEAEYVPVPFAELRGTLRRIDHEDATAYGRDDETQAYLQFHFSF